MRQFRKFLLGAIIGVVVLGNAAYADTIDFSGLSSGDTGFSSLKVGIGTFDVWGGTVNVYLPNPPNLSASFPTSGGMCALSANGCGTDWTLTFDYGVTNLTFESASYDAADLVTVDAFNGAAWISMTTVASNGTLNFGNSVITKLVFDDGPSYAGGVKFGDFKFDKATTVPEPATAGLIAVALAGLGFSRRKNA